MQNAKLTIFPKKEEIEGDDAIFVLSEATNPQPTLRSERRDCQQNMPSREEEKPAKQG